MNFHDPSKLFCERCAELTRQLRYDPTAEPRPELMSGSCMWPDEFTRSWCWECSNNMRHVFHLRHLLTIGQKVWQPAVDYFQQLEAFYPDWPLFRPERRSAEIAGRVHALVEDLVQKVFDEMDAAEE